MLPYGMKWYLGIFTEGKELDFFVEVVCPLPEFLPLAEMNKNNPHLHIFSVCWRLSSIE